VVLARRLEQLLRENGDAFIAVAVESLESTWDITLDYEEVLQRHGLMEPMGSRGRMGRFFLASSEELSVLSELYEGLYGKKMETAVQEAERKELTRLTHPVEAPHELGPYQLVLSKLETTIGGGDPSQGRNFAAEFKELNEAMDLFRHDSSQGRRFAEAVTAFITAKLARRPSSEELALHLASDSERSVLRGLAEIIDIMSAGRNERFVELVDRAREAGLFGTVDTRGGEGSRPRGSKKRKPKK
jgi:hypothetical protein